MWWGVPPVIAFCAASRRSVSIDLTDDLDASSPPGIEPGVARERVDQAHVWTCSHATRDGLDARLSRGERRPPRTGGAGALTRVPRGARWRRARARAGGPARTARPRSGASRARAWWPCTRHRPEHRPRARRARQRRDPHVRVGRERGARGGARDPGPGAPGRRAAPRSGPERYVRCVRGRGSPHAAGGVEPRHARLSGQRRRHRRLLRVRRHDGGGVRRARRGALQGPLLPHAEAAAPARRRRPHRQRLDGALALRVPRGSRCMPP